MISELLTIVIPTRDRQDFLELCLQSVFDRQRVVPKVIVSDNSTSDLPAVRSLKERYGFSYVRQSGKLSMTNHHNACLDLVRTPWTLLLHDDDELYPQVLSKLDTFFPNCGDVGIIVGGFQIINEQSVVQAVWIPKTIEKLKGEDGLLRIGLDFKSHPPSTLYKTTAFRDAGGFPDALGAAADYPLVLRLAYSDGLAFFPEVLGCYRIGTQQGTDYSLAGAERTLDCTIHMSNLTRKIGCPPHIADQLVDYNTWWVFRIVAGRWFSSHPFFVLRLFRKSLLSTPATGYWKSQIKQEYPFLFFKPRWLSILLYKFTNSFLPSSVRRRLRNYKRLAWMRRHPN